MKEQIKKTGFICFYNVFLQEVEKNPGPGATFVHNKCL